MKTTKSQLWHLNSSWGEHDLSATFIMQGFWEIDPSRLSDNVSVNRLMRMKHGDAVYLVRYSRNICISTEAIGVVTGINYRKMKVSVRWQQIAAPQRAYHKGTVRPISGPFALKSTEKSSIDHKQ
jgi:hypothetical protein